MKMSDEAPKMQIGFDIAELQVISLGKGDVLSVKLIGDSFDEATMQSLQAHLAPIFPKNKVMVFTMPTGSDIVFEAVKQSPEKGCGTASYCSDCNCGKKEQAEGDSSEEVS